MLNIMGISHPAPLKNTESRLEGAEPRQPRSMRLWNMIAALHSGLYDVFALRPAPTYSTDPDVRRSPLRGLVAKPKNSDAEVASLKNLSIDATEILLDQNDIEYWEMFQKGARQLRMRIQKLERIAQYHHTLNTQTFWSHLWNIRLCGELLIAQQSLSTLYQRVHDLEEHVEFAIFGSASRLRQSWDAGEFNAACAKLHQEWDVLYDKCAKLLGIDIVAGVLSE